MVTIDGRALLYFSGTGYLGLQSRPQVIEALAAAAARSGVHSATSRLRAGVSPALREAELEAAAFFGTDTALTCASGYLSPWMLLQAIQSEFDTLCLDRRAHASLRDAAACSRLPVEEVDVAGAGPDFVASLGPAAAAGHRPLALVDGVFSATGEVAPLARIHERLARCPGSGLLVDDAHGFGCLGDRGRGAYELAGLWERVNRLDPADPAPALFACGTLSKALGGFGGIVPASHRLAGAIVERSHVYRAAAALPAALAAASAAALAIARSEPGLRGRLADNLAELDAGLRQLGWPTSGGPAPVRALRGDGAELARIHAALLERGIFAPHVRGYGGADGGGVLRIAVFASHASTHLQALLAALREIGGGAGPAGKTAG